MKRIIAIALFALATLGMVGTAAAQSHQVRANIPFDFIAGSEHMPAGTYTITSEDLLIVVIQNGEHQASLLRSAPADDIKVDGKIVFNKYGNQYFLSEILSSQAHMQLKLPVSKLERKARYQMADLRANDQTSVALGQYGCLQFT